MQIADALQTAVGDGSLKPGDRLPPQRQLAAQLDVDLTTITRAYDEARRRNLLEGRGASGTYVSAPKVELNAIFDLSMNTPPPPEGVDFDDLLKQGLSQVLMQADAELLMTYHLAGGSDSVRKAGAQWLAPMFGPLDAQQLLVCPGAQAAIAALILTLSEPGDVILSEPASYPGLRAAATQFGRQLVMVESDQQGMLPAKLEQACRQHKRARKRACATAWRGTFWQAATSAPEMACMYGSNCRRIGTPRNWRVPHRARASPSRRRKHSPLAAHP